MSAYAAVLARGESAYACTVLINGENVLLHHDGYVCPSALGEHAGNVGTVGGVPTCGEGAVGVGVEHKLSPARSGALVPVGEGVGTDPVFDGGFVVLRAEHVRNAEARLLEIDNLVGHSGGGR